MTVRMPPNSCVAIAGVGSRAELTISNGAARRWRELDSQFRAWTLTPMSAG